MLKRAINNYMNKMKPAVDGILIISAFLVSFLVRFSGSIPLANFMPFKRFWPLIAFMGMASLWLVGLYEDRHRRPSELMWLIGLSSFLTMLLVTGLLYLMGSYSLPRTVLALYLLIATLFIFMWRLFISKMHQTKRVLFIGDKGEYETIAPKFESFIGEESFIIVNMINLKELPLNSAVLHGVDVICISASVPNDLREKIMIDALQWNVELYIVPHLYEIMLKGAEISRLDDSMYFKVKFLGLDPVQRFVKRTFDIFLALTGLALVLWLFPLIALAIHLDSPGSAFYSQVRAGRDGVLFKIYKFRTMINDAERLTGPVIATAKDSRITRVGKFLRKTRLDEIPQLWNVLKGEMSFVGPRPERPNFVQEFSKNVSMYSYRMKVKPGITGLAQVEGNYSTNYKDKLRFDLMYIRNYSLLLDLQIIAKTIRVVLMPEKASGSKLEKVLEYQSEVAASNGS